MYVARESRPGCGPTCRLTRLVTVAQVGQRNASERHLDKRRAIMAQGPADSVKLHRQAAGPLQLHSAFSVIRVNLMGPPHEGARSWHRAKPTRQSSVLMSLPFSLIQT